MKNKICVLAFCSALLGVGTAEAAYVSVTDATGNGALATALNLDAKFDKVFDANIQSRSGGGFVNISQSYFHASANATTGTSGSLDWYSFTTSSTNVTAVIDIDSTSSNLNSWIKLYNAAGVEIASNNNAGFIDAGSTRTVDSYLRRVLANPGIFYLSVGRAFNPAGPAPVGQFALNANQNYTVHVSLSNHVLPTPIPAAVWLFGSGLAGLLGLKRKKIA